MGLIWFTVLIMQVVQYLFQIIYENWINMLKLLEWYHVSIFHFQVNQPQSSWWLQEIF